MLYRMLPVSNHYAYTTTTSACLYGRSTEGVAPRPISTTDLNLLYIGPHLQLWQHGIAGQDRQPPIRETAAISVLPLLCTTTTSDRSTCAAASIGLPGFYQSAQKPHSTARLLHIRRTRALHFWLSLSLSLSLSLHRVRSLFADQFRTSSSSLHFSSRIRTLSRTRRGVSAMGGARRSRGWLACWLACWQAGLRGSGV